MQRNALTALVRRRIWWLAFVLTTLVAGPAMADPKVEKDAQALQKKAIEEDSLAVQYPAAIKKLQTAITKCDGDKCNSALKASLLRDLGAMQVLNGSVDEGKASFGQAIALDGTIDLDPSYKTPQLQAVWDDVKKNGGGAAAAAAAPAKAGPEPTGDFVHTPPSEAQVRTPLPVYVEYTGTEDLDHVKVKYKGAGASDWKTLDLPKLDSGFGALIPCKDVTQGLMLYFIQGFNDKNDPVATSGSKKEPFSVPVNAQLVGPAPSLPGQDPPAQCEDVAGGGSECPPDFPGCKKEGKAGGEDCEKDDECSSGSCADGKCAEKKANGDDCEKDNDCASGTCSSNKCSGGKKAEGEECDSDDDCDSDKCTESKCAESTSGHGGGKRTKVWIGVGVGLDIDILPSANDVCSLTTGKINPQGYGCVQPGFSVAFPDDNPNGATYYKDLVIGKGDQVDGGLKVGNLRLMASLDYALSGNSLLGLRVGYVLFTDPAKSAFAPLHLEGRFSYLFGKNAVDKKGLAPMITLGVGAGEFDAFVPVTVHLQTPPPPAAAMTNQAGAVNAWLVAGPVFGAVGGGARLLVTPKIALTGLLKFQAAFGGAAGFLPGLAPELGIQFGL